MARSGSHAGHELRCAQRSLQQGLRGRRRNKVSGKRRSIVLKAMVAAGVSVQQLLQEGNTAEQLAAAGVDVQPAAGAAAAGMGGEAE